MKSKLFPVDPRGLDDVARDLLNGAPADDDSIPPREAANVSNPESYIILPGKTHGTYSYPEILVSQEKYHLGKNWDQAHQELQRESSFMLTPRQFVDFLNLLRRGHVYDGRGRMLDSSGVSKLYNEITEKRDPWRAEWLDAKFSETSGNSAITYHKIKSDGSLEKVTEPIEECLREDKTPGIDMDYWLNNATRQGLPARNNPDGSLYYRHPIKGAVARFRAGSGWVDLGCNGDSLCSFSALGSRRAKIFHRK